MNRKGFGQKPKQGSSKGRRTAGAQSVYNQLLKACALQQLGLTFGCRKEAKIKPVTMHTHKWSVGKQSCPIPLLKGSWFWHLGVTLCFFNLLKPVCKFHYVSTYRSTGICTWGPPPQLQMYVNETAFLNFLPPKAGIKRFTHVNLIE